MRRSGIQSNSYIISRNNQSKVYILIIIEVDFWYLDDEEISLYACFIKGYVALDRGYFWGLVGDCDAHGMEGWDKVEVEVFSDALEIFFAENITDLELLLLIVH